MIDFLMFDFDVGILDGDFFLKQRVYAYSNTKAYLMLPTTKHEEHHISTHTIVISPSSFIPPVIQVLFLILVVFCSLLSLY